MSFATWSRVTMNRLAGVIGTVSDLRSGLTTKIPDCADIKAACLDTLYDSGEQTISAAGALTLAHGLGFKPKNVNYFIVCKTAENGYSVGDELSLGAGMSYVGAATNFQSVIYNTNIFIRFGAYTNPIAMLHKTTGAGVYGTNANWKFIVRVEK